jgi:hypothetical protein
MRLQSWPDIGFWPTTIIMFVSALFVIGFAADLWLGTRIEQIARRQSADPTIKPLMGVVQEYSRVRNVRRSAHLIAEPERTWAVLWAHRLRRYYIVLSLGAGVAFIALLVNA